MQTYGLPSAYRRVEYIQNPQHAFIDTGIAITRDLQLRITYKVPGSLVSRYVMGHYAGNSGDFYLFISGGSHNGFIQTAFGTLYFNTIKKYDNAKHKLLYTIENSKLYVYQDGELITPDGKEIIEKITSRSIKVAGTEAGGTIPVNTYSVNMTKAGIMIRNFIPCVRKTDNKPGMYDTVSKTFYINAGTGEFIIPA